VARRRPSTTSSPPCRGSTTAAPSTTSGRGVEDLVTPVNAAWNGPRAPKLRLLPQQVTLEAVRELGGQVLQLAWQPPRLG